MAGYKSDFAGNVDYAFGGRTRDIAGNLERGVANATAGAGGLAATVKQAAAARRSIKDLTTEMNAWQQAQAQVAQGTPQWVALQQKIDGVRKSIGGLQKDMRQMPFDVLEKGFGKLTKGLIGFNTSLLAIGFDFLIDSIKRVYELQERWTKAVGGFNMKIGGSTVGLKSMTKAAVSLSGQLRGLTNGDIADAIQGFGEFNDALGSTTDKAVKFAQTSLQLSRGFDLGWSGAGKLVKGLSSMGDGVGDVDETMKDLVKGANAAGVSTNMVAKDVEEASTYMVRFGKENQKMFVQGAAYARKYGISIGEVQKSVEGLDMFDEATKTAAKLNTVFGTMINSMDLMMEDDPAKRLETIRQQFLAQGATYDKLTPKQRRFLSETLHLNEEQTAALLDQKNANQSYADFQAKAAAKEKAEISAKKLMQQQLQATSQTMYAFGAAFDRITVAIANAIKPLLRVFGLASDGNKKFKSFGEVMASVTTTVESFFNSLAKDPKWQSFMEELGHDLQRAGAGLKEFVMDGRAAQLVGDIASGMHSFYNTVRDLAMKAVPFFKPVLDVILTLSNHIGLLATAWGGLKLFNGLGGINGLGGKGLSLLGKGMGALGGGSKLLGAGRLGFAGAAGAAGAAVGGTGAGIGSGVGGLIGSFFGPIGMAAGPILGGILGHAIERAFFTKDKTAVERAHEQTLQTMEEESKKREQLTGVVDMATSHQEITDRIHNSQDRILQSMHDSAIKQTGQQLTLNSDEVDMLKSRRDELARFSKSSEVTRKLIDGLGAGSQLSASQLQDLLTAAQGSTDSLTRLRDVAKQQADLESAQLEVSGLGLKKESMESTQKLRDLQIKQAEADLKRMGGRVDVRNEVGSDIKDLYGGGGAKAVLQAISRRAATGGVAVDSKVLQRLEAEAKLDDLREQSEKGAQDLQRLQTDFVKQQTIITLRSAVRQDADFRTFAGSAGEKDKSPEQQMLDFLKTPEGLAAVGGEGGAALLREGNNFAPVSRAQALPSNSVFNTSPSPYVSNLPQQTNFAAPTGGSGPASPIVVNVNTHIDGKQVGRSSSVVSGMAQGLVWNPVGI